MSVLLINVAAAVLHASACCGPIEQANTRGSSFERPFAPTSIWNRPIPADAQFADVQDAIWGDPDETPTHLGVDLVSVLFTDLTYPQVDFRLTRGWNYPQRSWPRGEALFRRRLAPDAGTELRFPKTGNALYVIIDPDTGRADEGVGAWRNPTPPQGREFSNAKNLRPQLASTSTDFLTLYDDDLLHNIDVINGDGLDGPRGSGLSALGGTIRLGELDTGINHALAVMGSSRRYSRDNPFMWPASRADGYADNPIWGYLGADPNYAMGTLLAIPPSVDLQAMAWNTPQGLILAQSAQTYGWYIVDSGTGGWGGHSFKFAMERDAATIDLGLMIDPITDEMTIDPMIADADGLNLDVQQILTLVQAVTNNRP